MRAEVRPLNLRGKPLDKAVRARTPASHGTLRVFENRLHVFGRAVTCATLTSTTDGLETMLLPELLDVQIIWADDYVMRLRGNEQLDGAFFGQTWEVRVL